MQEFGFYGRGPLEFGRSSTGGHDSLIIKNGKKEGNKDRKKEMAGPVRFEEQSSDAWRRSCHDRRVVTGLIAMCRQRPDEPHNAGPIQKANITNSDLNMQPHRYEFDH